MSGPRSIFTGRRQSGTSAEAAAALAGLLLGTQMCEYNPSKRLLPGDWKMRVCSVQKKKADQPDSPYKKRKRNPDEVVTKQQYENEKKNQQKGKKARFCSLETLLYHQEHKKSEPHEAKCVVCRQNCYTSCSICGVRLHFPGTKKEGCDGKCFVNYHNNEYLGLCACDYPLRGLKTKDYKKPTKKKINENKKQIRSYEASF